MTDRWTIEDVLDGCRHRRASAALLALGPDDGMPREELMTARGIDPLDLNAALAVLRRFANPPPAIDRAALSPARGREPDRPSSASGSRAKLHIADTQAGIGACRMATSCSMRRAGGISWTRRRRSDPAIASGCPRAVRPRPYPRALADVEAALFRVRAGSWWRCDRKTAPLALDERRRSPGLDHTSIGAPCLPN